MNLTTLPAAEIRKIIEINNNWTAEGSTEIMLISPRWRNEVRYLLSKSIHVFRWGAGPYGQKQLTLRLSAKSLKHFGVEHWTIVNQTKEHVEICSQHIFYNILSDEGTSGGISQFFDRCSRILRLELAIDINHCKDEIVAINKALGGVVVNKLVFTVMQNINLTITNLILALVRQCHVEHLVFSADNNAAFREIFKAFYATPFLAQAMDHVTSIEMSIITSTAEMEPDGMRDYLMRGIKTKARNDGISTSEEFVLLSDETNRFQFTLTRHP